MSSPQNLKEEYEGKLVRLGYLSQLWQYYAQRKNDLSRQQGIEREIAKLADAEITTAPQATDGLVLPVL